MLRLKVRSHILNIVVMFPIVFRLVVIWVYWVEIERRILKLKQFATS
ncbi:MULTISPECIES: hypothetical protein [Citrobacter]|nr:MULTISPECIES: hypothetical protein [Citrobacter]MDM2731468.1 hypothetical protein [Citrobacter sp. Cy070]